MYNQELVRALGVMYTHVHEGISHKLRAHGIFLKIVIKLTCNIIRKKTL